VVSDTSGRSVSGVVSTKFINWKDHSDKALRVAGS